MTGIRWRFRPRLWPTLTALAAMAVLVGLGTWQPQRLAAALLVVYAVHQGRPRDENGAT